MPGLEENGKDKNLTKLLYDEQYSGGLIDITGLHFSGEGYKILFDEVTKLIAEKYPDETPENIKNPIKMQWEIDIGW
ncbi:hypothetical protein BOTNAR_0412g00040 [Botryotinia narcissicola]|uniref:SGNH hydrolase-type esterase domain-containing protein n=1 Tax=Botryotinia narcissicola TaxID=278944 RepID=A0A4Z1HYX5_9HELO|nr:hypothetical protein BOTNAR_0412g00040 [Botryotinia narcissicola]